VNKQYGTNILISDATYQKIMKRVYVREVDRVQVVGKMEPVRIYELLDMADKPLSEKMKYFLDIFGQGLKAYQERRWDEGIAYMEHAMLQIPNDPVSQLYIERMKLFKINPPDENWNGVFVLHAK
jgi:adenylate cyclase